MSALSHWQNVLGNGILLVYVFDKSSVLSRMFLAMVYSLSMYLISPQSSAECSWQ